MRRIITGIVAAVLSVVGLTAVTTTEAHADTITTTGYLSQYLDHGGNPALGRVRFEAWIPQLRNDSGLVYGTFGLAKVTDIGGGVTAVEIRRNALGWLGGTNLGTCQVNETDIHQDTPGNGLYADGHTHDICGHSSWANTIGDPNAAGILRTAVTIAVRWADGQLGVYDLNSAAAFWYRCAGSQQINVPCGSTNQTTSV